MNQENLSLTVVRKSLVLIICALLILWIAYQIKSILICTFMAFILASAIAPAAEYLEKRKIPRVATVIGIYILIAIIYVLLAKSLAPVIREQAQQLYQNMPEYIDRVVASVEKLEAFAGSMAGAGAVNTLDVDAMIKNFGVKLLGNISNVTHAVIDALLNTIFVLFLTAYFVIEADKIWPQLLLWLPETKRIRAATLIRPLEVRLGGYVRGQLLVSVCVAVILGTGLTLLGVKYSLVLGLIAGFMNIVPFVGSFITMVFSVIVAANQSPMLGLAAFGLYVFEQWLESNFIVPHLLGKNVDLHPLIVLFALLIGGTLLGLAGAVIAVPAASAMLFLAREFYWKPLNPDLTINEPT